MPNGWLRETEDQKKFRTYRSLGGRLSFDQWVNAGKPLTPAEEKAYITPYEKKRREEAERVMRTDEFNVILNYPETGQVRLPDGKITTLDWYQKLPPAQKIQVTGVNPYGMAPTPLLPGGGEGVPPSIGVEEAEPGIDYKVEQQGGYDVWIGRSPTGEILEYQIIGRTPEAEMEEVEGLSEYERENLALARQREARLQRESEWSMQQQPDETYQQYRQRLLGELAGPGDWIKRWQVAYGGWPSRQPSALQEQATRGSWEIRQARDLATQKREAAIEAFAADEPERGRRLRQEATELTKLQRETEQAYEPAIQEQRGIAQRGMETGIWPEVSRQPSAPRAPAWLPQFAPGQTAGQAITKQWVPTPSPQTWAKTPWSIREGLRGFTEWSAPASRAYRDILEHMQVQIPSAPKGARGIQRWRPKTQWR